MSEQRIYAVIPRHVKLASGRTVFQSTGRMSAQGSHAEALLRHGSASFPKDQAFVNIATIHLECRDQEEMNHIIKLLSKRNTVQWVIYFDTNKDVYGTTESVASAAAFFMTKHQSIGTLDYLPLFPLDRPNQK